MAPTITPTLQNSILVLKKNNNSGMWSDSGNENKIWRTMSFIINNHQ